MNDTEVFYDALNRVFFNVVLIQWLPECEQLVADAIVVSKK